MALAFFEQEVSDDMKRRMVAAFDKDGDEDPPKRALRKGFSKNCLADVVTDNICCLFLKMKMDQKCLMEDTNGSWNDQPGYLMARKLVQGIHVTNDDAERGVVLIEECNRLVTHDEDQLQFLM